MQIPILTSERIHHIVQSEAAWMSSRLRCIQEQFSDSGVQIARFGDASAFMVKRFADDSFFNRVIGLTAQDQGSIDDILEWYAESQVPCQIDLCPYQTDQDLLLSLTKHGLYQWGHWTVLYGQPSSHVLAIPQQIVVREIHQQELDIFSSVFGEGFLEFHERPEAKNTLNMKAVEGLYARPGWHLYLAFFEGIPAAVGMLYIQDKTASLIAGTTIPQLRGKGCQAALIQQRIADAAQAGCNLVVTQTRAGTTSQRNMERAGLRIAYTRSVWKTL